MTPSAKRKEPPQAHELEMNVFGPGVGECIVLHLGNGEWMVVDSCLAPGTSEPAALGYFREIGVDAATQVRCVLATHWHDDHIAGLSDVLSECTNAKFVMSAALGLQEFARLVLEVDEANKHVRHNSSASEFREILKTLQSRSGSRFGAGPDVYAQDGTRIYCGGYGAGADVWAISPSAAVITNAFGKLASLLATGNSAKRFKQFSPNDLSVAALVKVGGRCLLLGADLENSHCENFGWKAVLRSALRIKDRSQGIKVPHHGSANAHHNEVWSSMLTEHPVAVVTPFAKLAKPIPTPQDMERIGNLSAEAYCTTWPLSKKPPTRRGVDGIVNSATRHRHAMNPSTGHVRIRMNLCDDTAPPEVELFGSASKVR